LIPGALHEVCREFEDSVTIWKAWLANQLTDAVDLVDGDHTENFDFTAWKMQYNIKDSSRRVGEEHLDEAWEGVPSVSLPYSCTENTWLTDAGI
jgi:hypothetical protein